MNQHAKRRHQAGIFDLPDDDDDLPRPPPRLLATPEAGKRSHTVDETGAGQRLDRYLAGLADAAGEALSRTRIQALIEDGQVTIDGRAARDAKSKVRAGQIVTIDVPPPVAAEPEGENIPLDIVFEDEHLIIVDKPAGLVVHPSAGHETGTLVNALIAHCGASLSGVGGVRRPGIVHRIDKDTSGLLVVAKTDAAHQGLAALFADHGRTMRLEREYLALVWGAPQRGHGTIETAIGRHPTHREKQAVVRDDRGREAITHWELQETFGKRDAPIAALVACHLETGRTHQIRVHMAHIGHPLLGDPVYATGFRTKAARLDEEPRQRLEQLGRQALHAAVLGFDHPITGEALTFESELPQDMAVLLEALRTQAE
ncbi:RluA family pseudouridine synthase [Methylocella sp. CPCC 101449]|uniref:RluA family pseudouridine synthase n=1 Tax=Methylocella sp. CPCC 101449 TaxID=2987531 RepID=UPI002890A365|nr:RluA family pseudouridine synthase [Methylocella sp. CPCC 101449]MDT2023383.1 RluA family pseudouridine synthase [Methylocella sp. CPCC 101449]